MKRVVFLTFADYKYRESLYRLKNQVSQSKYITDIYIFTEKDLGKDFRRNFHPWLYRRGYGYWKWKSYLVQKVLDNIDEGDILIYSDAGCVFNKSADDRLLYYIDKVRTSKSGLLVFAQNLIEKDWTKSDCFDYFGVIKEKKITDTPQTLGGIFFICKNDISQKIVEKWVTVTMDHYDLITDKRSQIPNFDSFVEHRHDQSILSILAKIYKAETIPSSEMDKNNFDMIPIQPKRLKQKNIYASIKGKCLIPFRYCIGLYLKYFKQFYFKNRIAW